MKIELQKKLFDRFEFLKSSRTKEGFEKYPFQMFLFECGDGWFKLLWQLCEKIEKELKKDKYIDKEYFCVTQIKEKFGGLRFYISTYSEKIEKEIVKAMHKSYKTCENCGKRGKPNREGWIITLCNKCRNKK